MFIWLMLVIGGVFLDQITKWLSVIFLEGHEPIRIIPYFLRLEFLDGGNTGAAWGMFSDQRWVFITVSTVALIGVLLYVYIKRPKNKLLMASLALIVAGGIGNMIDRVFLGFVIDFITFDFMEFPIFNGADSFVCIGAALLMLYLIIETVKEYKNEKSTKNGSETDSGNSGDTNADSNGSGSGNEA